MTFKTYEINVDLVNETSTPATIRFSQNDQNSAKLLINIKNKGEELDLGQATAVRISFKKSDGTRVFQDDCQPINTLKGKYQIVLKTQTLTSIGNVLAQIHITENDRIIDTQQFVFVVKESLASDEAIESTNEFGVIQKIIEANENLKDVNFDALIASEKTANEAKEASVQNAKKTDERPGVIPPPAKFPWKNPQIMIKKDIFGRYNAVFDIEKFVPAVGKAYYVDVNGVDTNDGLTSATAFKSFSKALLQADARIIYVAPGTYDRNKGWIKTNPASSTLVIKPLYKGDIIFSTHQDGLVWAAEGTDKVYKTARSAVVNVYDGLDLDEYGDHKELIKKASIAEVSATPGSWFADATSVYVRLKDDRVPDNTVKVYVTGGNGWVQGTKSIYMEGIKFYGGDSPFETLTASATDNMNLYFKNCEFKYGTKGDLSANGLTIKGARQVFLQNCIAAQNQRDGFNYHVYTSIVPNAIEIDCIGYKNGVGNAENNNNGSTMHDSGNIIRVNCIYFKNKGPNVVDVGSSNAWNIGCVSYNSVSTTTSSHINFQTQDGKMWLDGCVSYDSNVDVSVVGTGVAYARRTLKSNQLFETPEY
ncbi:BppU family phage baseplate upper protein [Bacillus sp. FSL R12-0074]|uniref:BppU family phage baseplate upper protein n=1 Tax=Bacillus sp. FSL R12-0074 TaxID=2954664 RepID=UPI0030F88ED4